MFKVQAHFISIIKIQYLGFGTPINLVSRFDFPALPKITLLTVIGVTLIK